ncbi:uncharacterized protein LOC120674431 isoform X2 [Panicum virgatum]|uniref:uncharacterized protein LOC120674431 isoform X2 n=1 Tax=Panicum virgatum TaxID=38727 RepID=UPI0019D626BE|nr:uncharacterized protein LOC120674431 isoform X2 [Panicum virgatum]
MGGAAPARLPLPHPRPPRLHSHQSTPVPYLHASAPAAATSATLSVPRPARSPSVRVARPRRRAAMSAAAASSSIGCKVYGQTATTDHHSELTDIGIIPSLKGSTIGPKFPYVIFCAPPYRSEDYVGDLRVAASNWNGEGSFLFTSSTAVYDCSDNGLCSEDSPCVQIGQSPRTDVLLKAENVVLEAGGCVLRLVGLYKSDRGPHVYWLSKGTLDARPDHVLNLIHYEDAASLAIAIMKKGLRSRVFVGCDNEPLSRQEIMDRVNRSGKFDTEFQGFTGTDGPLGKRMENSKTRAEIGWQPKYPSFTEFLGLTNP